MSGAGFDSTELLVMTECFDNIEEQFPKESKEFLRKQGTELNRQT